MCPIDILAKIVGMYRSDTFVNSTRHVDTKGKNSRYVSSRFSPKTAGACQFNRFSVMCFTLDFFGDATGCHIFQFCCILKGCVRYCMVQVYSNRGTKCNSLTQLLCYTVTLSPSITLLTLRDGKHKIQEVYRLTACLGIT